MNTSRRKFLTVGSAAAFGMATNCRLQANQNKLPLTIAGYSYERVRALQDGRVEIPGCDATFETGKIGPLNTHAFNGPATRDVTELGLIPYLLAFANDDFRKYQLLPVFVLKVFRHKSVFVRSDGNINKPSDLRGKKVATVGYSSSGLTWIRGIFQDEYGLKPSDIHWVVTAKDSADAQTGSASKWEKLIPPGISWEPAPDGMDDSDLLLNGSVDAIFHPAEPRAFAERDPKIRRLFTNPREVESEYFKKTGIFPIMHVVAIRRDLSNQRPWLAPAIFNAYSQG